MSTTHKAWWLLLIGVPLAVPLALAISGSLFEAIFVGMLGISWLVAAALLTAIPAALYRLIYKRLTLTEFLSMYTAAWVLVPVAKFWLPQSMLGFIWDVGWGLLVAPWLVFPVFVLLLLIGILAGGYCITSAKNWPVPDVPCAVCNSSRPCLCSLALHYSPASSSSPTSLASRWVCLTGRLRKATDSHQHHP